MEIVIDNESGFCFGVRRAIATAEEILEHRKRLFCVGDIVHNEREIERLEKEGLMVIHNEELVELSDSEVLFRAHGEPPSSYAIIKKNNLRLTDATCPVVLKLQENIRNAWEKGRQIVLFGKKGHAEVIGLMGQTNGECILIENISQIDKIDIERETEIFSQTTQNIAEYESLIEAIRAKMGDKLRVHQTICKQMTDRAERLKSFALEHETIVFVGGSKSSNSKVLFDICRSVNKNSHLVTNENDLKVEWFKNNPKSIGIFGATSTPLWLMQLVKRNIENLELWKDSYQQ